MTPLAPTSTASRHRLRGRLRERLRGAGPDLAAIASACLVLLPADYRLQAEAVLLALFPTRF